jgi:hypothetical protein
MTSDAWSMNPDVMCQTRSGGRCRFEGIGPDSNRRHPGHGSVDDDASDARLLVALLDNISEVVTVLDLNGCNAYPTHKLRAVSRGQRNGTKDRIDLSEPPLTRTELSIGTRRAGARLGILWMLTASCSRPARLRFG